MIRLIRRRWIWLLLAVLVVGGGSTYFYCGRHMPKASAAAAKPGTRYRCPMHPNYISDKAGDCPICGMKLVPIVEEKPGAHAPTAGNVAEVGPAVAGQAMVTLSPEKQQLIGVRTEVVMQMPLTKVVRSVGQVTADETRISRVYSKVGGWVEKLYVNFTGISVKKGQPLLSIYSPELVSTQEEYLLALRARRQLRSSPFGEVSDGGESLLAATRRRLQLWDVSESEIRRVEQAGHPIKTITLYAPATGYVMEKPVLEGQKVDPATPLMVVADLGVVWIQAEFYEEDIPLVRVGEQAKLTLNAYPDRTWSGVLDYIYPSVDPQTRTLRARLRVANPGLILKPGMYANVMIEKRLGHQLTVAEEAVLDSGTRQIVFIDRGRGHFEPREVKVGQRAEGRREILSGVKPGDRVVSSGNFLVDSESRLQAGIAGMEATPAHAHGPAPAKGAAPAPQGKPGAMPGMPGM